MQRREECKAYDWKIGHAGKQSAYKNSKEGTEGACKTEMVDG